MTFYFFSHIVCYRFICFIDRMKSRWFCQLSVILCLGVSVVKGAMWQQFVKGEGCGTVNPIKTVLFEDQIQDGDNCLLIRTHHGT